MIPLGFYDFAAAQAGRAHADALGRALHFRVDRPQIDVPAPLSDVMGVADVISKLRPLAANLTNLCHGYSGCSLKLILEELILRHFVHFGEPLTPAVAEGPRPAHDQRRATGTAFLRY